MRYRLILFILVLMCSFFSNEAVFASEYNDDSEIISVGVQITNSVPPVSPVFDVMVSSSYRAEFIGKTIENGRVSLHIFNDFYNLYQEISADSNGDWKFETDVLTPGFYYANAFVVDIFGQKSSISDNKSFQIIINAPDFIFSISDFNEVIYTGFFGLPNENIRIVLAMENGKRVAYNTFADENGNWIFVTNALRPGKYVTSAQIFINNGQTKSAFSTEKYFTITEISKKVGSFEKISRIIFLISSFIGGIVLNTLENPIFKFNITEINYLEIAIILMIISVITLMIALIKDVSLKEKNARRYQKD